MSARRWLAGAGAWALVSLSAPGQATAFMDPAHAPADVESALREGDYAFCRSPREPLSWDARALCPHATAIPGCDGLAAACARAEAPPRESRDLPGWLVDAIGWILGGVARFVAWVLLPALVLALLWPAVRALARVRRERALAEPAALAPTMVVDHEPVETPVAGDEEVLLGRAEHAARAGRYAAALELYLAAALRALDKRGAVKMSKDRTHGEYVRGCTDAAAKPSLRTLVREVDRVKFGHELATEEATQRAGTVARALVQGVALVLATATLLGCGAGGWPGPPRPGDDPAGQELLVDLLHRQGIRATALDRPLSSLPAPTPGTRATAVIVDVERTELDDETRSHLLGWVDAGGSLVLAGAPARWPKELDFGPSSTSGPRHLLARRLLAGPGTTPSEESDDEPEDPRPAAPAAPVYAASFEHGTVAQGSGLRAAGAERVAWFEDETTYAAVIARGQGSVVGIASGELMTNAALARPGNAGVLLAILSNADSESFQIAQPEDGVSPPTNPLAALSRAGLGLGLAHALVAALVLFLAAGTRLHRPVAEPPPARRAFIEHVEAVGALYRRTGLAAHALAAYTRFAEERLRARMPRGMADVPSFLASRAWLPLDVCQRVWARATGARPDAARGDELEVLKELSLVYSRATDQER